MAEVRTWQGVEDFDSIQLAMPDIHSVPRGKVVSGEFKEPASLLKEGWDMWRGAPMLGPNSEISLSVPYLADEYPSHKLRPCIETLTPWHWVSSTERRVGNILCDLYQPDGIPDFNCPRQQLKKQLDDLWNIHGLIIKTAFEYEFFAFKENTLEPLGSSCLQFCDLRVWGKHQVLFSELRDSIEAMGIKIRSVQAEFSPGQWELTTVPYPGVTGADVGFYVKNAVKGFLKNHGYDATFMTRPTLGSISSGLHLNHSLWKPSSSADDKEEQNMFLGNDGALSKTANHWIAGLLTHAEALSALLSPSFNCYRRLHGQCAPSFATWGRENRSALIRARFQGNNVFLENRLVSAAASPYLALAGTVAAGLDGLERRLQCPPPDRSTKTRKMPCTLAEALSALKEDHELLARLGEDFVHCFVESKRENEIMPFEKVAHKTEEEQIAFERDMYFQTY